MPAEDTPLRTYPKLPQKLRQEFQRQAATVGLPALALRTGLSHSCLHRLITDKDCTARQSTIDALSQGLAGKESTGQSNGHSNGNGQPSDGEFSVRIVLGTKRAQRLLAHCELRGETMSAFVGRRIDEFLDQEWGKE